MTGTMQFSAGAHDKDVDKRAGACSSAPAVRPLAHRPVLADEAPREVLSRPDGIYVDATFGRGGHSRRLLKLLGAGARLFAFDRDEEAVAAARAIDDARFSIIHAPFSEMAARLAERGVARVDGILMDIGVSSPQIDDPQRGFSFRFDGPLDMRMDTSTGMTAAEWIARADAAEIERVLRDYGEERCAGRIARAICAARADKPFARTGELADFIARTIGRSHKDAGQHPATRSFQAIRIHINGELDELARALDEAGMLLAPGGRLAVISFHSLEDRMVKRFFDAGAHPERAVDARIALRQSDLPEPLWRDVRRVKPSRAECEENPRARSAVMRSACRTERSWDGAASAGGAR